MSPSNLRLQPALAVAFGLLALGLTLALSATPTAYIIGLVVTALSAGVGWWVGGRWAQALTALAQAAERIQHEPSATFPAVEGAAEIVTLSKALQAMHSAVILQNVKLREANAEVEKRLQEQTQALEQASQAIGAMEDTIQQQSIRDPLTGLFNRDYMMETLEREIERSRREKTSLGVIVMDVDYFKRFNDTYGHAVGNVLLREIARFLQHNIRLSDVICRYGGEEFIVVLPGATPEAAQQRAEALRRQIKAVHFQHDGRSLGQVSFSFGVALFPHNGADGETLLRVAEAAMREAKRTGRDRVVIAAPDRIL